jgi:hypothetical protein
MRPSSARFEPPVRLVAFGTEELDGGEIALGLRDEVRWSCVLLGVRLLCTLTRR